MTKRLSYLFSFWLLTLTVLTSLAGAAQQPVTDTAARKTADTTLKPPADTSALPAVEPARDTVAAQPDTVRRFNPRVAALRSAIIPGWGQAYNKRYWKIPIVYGALGTAAGIFVYNVKYYRDLRFAVQAMHKASQQRDSVDYFRMEPRYRQYDQQTLRYYRDEFRRNIDYSVLAFVLLWGLNVVDATVDAHLRSFDVSPDLSFRVKPGYSELGNTAGVSFVLAFK